MTDYRRTSFREPPSARLSEYMRQGWSGDAERTGLRPAPPAELTARRRAALSARWPGVRLIIPSGQPRLRSGDSHYPFRPDSSYVWLTGDQTAGGVLVMDPVGGEHDATLYVRPPSGRSDDSFWLDGAHGELWVGPRPGLADLAERLGVACATLYTADITRTLPVSGTFTALQREVYEIVLAAQQAALAQIGPGQPFRGYHRAIAQVLAAGLEQLGALPVSAAESLREDCGLHRRWTLCAPGHMVGLDVHDCGDAPAESYIDGVLRPGNVLTVEPGLYFQRYDELAPVALRGLGVRIEDDVLVTPDGCELLSGTLPRTADHVEEWLAGGEHRTR